MSDLNDGYVQCYGAMNLTKAGFLDYKKWYAVHRSQITWDNLQRGLCLMSVSIDTSMSDTSAIPDVRRIKALESLRIK